MKINAPKSGRRKRLEVQTPVDAVALPRPPQHGSKPLDAEYKIFQVTRLPSTDFGALTLLTAFGERLTAEEEARLGASCPAIEGRAYWFAKAGDSHEVPLTEWQALDRRRNGWQVDDGREPRSKSELAMVEQLSRRHRRIEARRRRLAAAQAKWEAEHREQG